MRLDFDAAKFHWPRVVGDLTDTRLLERLLDEADAILEEPGLESHYILDAVARFQLPRATRFLSRVAEGTSSVAADARTPLARLGDDTAIAQCVEAALKDCAGPNRYLSMRDAERLADWPPHIVREALLRRIEQAADLWRWVFLLQWFAGPADIPLFERVESGPDIGAADIAHQYLRGRRPSPLRRRG